MNYQHTDCVEFLRLLTKLDFDDLAMPMDDNIYDGELFAKKRIQFYNRWKIVNYIR